MSVAPTQPVKRLTVAVLDGADTRPSRIAARAERADTKSRSKNATRRALDLLVATLLVLVAAPVMILIAFAVRLDSKGPVLFRQRRVGRGQREFTMLKFRTMRRDADAARHRQYVQTLIDGADNPERGRLYKLSVDDRITRIGRVLRSWSLDELPQLLNVIRGDMALVGPRPVIPYEVEMYPEDYLRRFAVKPGLTGLWQVSGRNERTYEEMVSFDIQYAESASLLLDLLILAKTVPVVLRRQGVA
ncbi:MAG TPA: sugar transferase [Solirubrobacteraceae bacterium]|jgi:lipopolysaccharide/colanic/teichoic acid biosynthesis glycosyltransferase